MLKNTLKLSLVLSVALSFSACQKRAEPQPVAKPVVEKKVVEKKVPKTEITRISIKKKKLGTIVKDSAYANTRGMSINMSKYPSVVIALPYDVTNTASRRTNLDRTKKFQAEGYIDKTEADVEKNLIKRGFSVVDRSKFEAKLRTIREESKNLNYGVFNTQMQSLTKDLNQNKITQKEFDTRQRRLLNTIAGKNRSSGGLNELVDMSELVRAAQSSGVKANYILQLNKTSEFNSYPQEINLTSSDKIENYLSKNPTMRYGKKSNEMPENISVPVYRVIFSAKLIDVNTGKVAWVGEQELTSLNIEDVTIKFNIDKMDALSQNPSYRVYDFKYYPQLAFTRNSSLSDKKMIREHRKELLNAAISSLFNTIKTK